MYITTIKFERALEWFNQSKYDYLLLYASGYSKLDYEMTNEFLKYKELIDRQTGSLVCFLHFIEKSDLFPTGSTILTANHNLSVEEFMLYHISTEEGKELSKRSLYGGVGMEATFDTTDRLCSFFNIPRYRLPAFIIIHKTSTHSSVEELKKGCSFFSIKSKYDLDYLLTPIKLANDLMIDLNSIKRNLSAIEKEPEYDDVKKEINGINKGINKLKMESKETLIKQMKYMLSEINTLLAEEYNIFCEVIPQESPYALKKRLSGLGVLNDFMNSNSDIYARYKALYNKVSKWRGSNDIHIVKLQKDLDKKIGQLCTSATKKERLRDLISEYQHILFLYKKKFEEKLMIEDASDFVQAIVSNNSYFPILLISTIKNFIDRQSLISSIISDIRDKVKKMQYNVFISCKSEDYELGEQVYDFLKANSYMPFIASKSLREIAEDKYSPVISEVIDLCDHMIVIASNPLYVETSYVKSEWEMFCNEVKAGRKTGKLITIIQNPKEGPGLPIDLRTREILSIANYKEDICKYLSNHS